jgi:predicted lipid-binding transport protein (Tim44 family)
MTVALRYRARWYREDRDTAEVLDGDKDDERTRTDVWTFALTDDPRDPWRLVAVGG